MNNLQQRILTGIIAGSAVVAAIYSHPVGLLVFCIVVSVLSYIEYKNLHGLSSIITAALSVGAIALWVSVTANYFLQPIHNQLIWMIQLLIVSFSGIVILYRKPIQQSFLQWAVALAGYGYIFIPFVLLFWLSFPNDSKEYYFMGSLGLLFLMWAADIGAYFVGKFLGKHYIFPSISPKKTWEGFIGGLLLTLLLGYFLQQYQALSDRNWVICGGIIAVLGLYGDLFESLMKRNADKKDSGSLLPGHGGFLDRFDGVFLAIPPVYVYIQLLKIVY